MSSLVLGDSLLLDWLPSPTSHLAVWNVLIHRDTWTVAPIPRKILQMPKLRLPLTISIMQISTIGLQVIMSFFSFLLRQKQQPHPSAAGVRWAFVDTSHLLHNDSLATLSPATFQGANLLPVRDPSGSGNPLVHLWRAQMRICQHAARPVAGSLVAVTQSPRERHPLRG